MYQSGLKLRFSKDENIQNMIYFGHSYVGISTSIYEGNVLQKDLKWQIRPILTEEIEWQVKGIEMANTRVVDTYAHS